MSNAAVFLVIFAGTAVLAVLTDRIRFFSRHEFLTGIALVGVAIAAILVRMCYVARDLTCTMLCMEVERIEADIDDQLNFGMQYAADVLIDRINKRGDMSRDELLDKGDAVGADAIHIVGSNGLVVVSSSFQNGTPYQSILSNPSNHAAYAELLAGKRSYVKERFRDIMTDPDDAIKTLAVRLPQGGFLWLGYKWSSFGHDFKKYFMPMFEKRSIGETGFFAMIDGHGKVANAITNHPEAQGKTLTEVGFRESDRSSETDTQFIRRILGRWCLCDTYESIGEWKGFAVLPLAEVVLPAASTSIFAAIILIVFCVVFRLMLVKLRRAQAKIDAAREKEEKRLAADLSLARSIQRAELREDGKDGAGYRIATLMNAAREVGGDFYDYYELPDGRLVITIADVSGKGIPAAFFMMKARMTLKSCVYSSPTLVEAMAKANVRLSRNNPAEMFVTVWSGIYDPKTREMEFVSAGHPAVLVRHQSSVEWLQVARSPAMGSFESARYRGAKVTLAAGDRLFLYTDGVTEAMNPAGELFGDKRLLTTLENGGASIPAVLQAIDTFIDGAEQSDDITMLEVEIK